MTDADVTRSTQKLLACGAVAGPLFVIVGLVQALTRPGFDLRRHALSALTLGSFGWIQSANFLIAGALFVASAVGLQRILRGGTGARWGPILMAAVGVGFVGGGVFVPDPSGGFPPGTPVDSAAVSSLHGVLHMIFGSTAFLSLISLCFVLARRFALGGERRWAIGSVVAGAVFTACLFAAGAPGGTLTLFVGASLALVWISLVCARFAAAQTPNANGEPGYGQDRFEVRDVVSSLSR